MSKEDREIESTRLVQDESAGGEHERRQHQTASERRNEEALKDQVVQNSGSALIKQD
jgi:hypothetical protein